LIGWRWRAGLPGLLLAAVLAAWPAGAQNDRAPSGYLPAGAIDGAALLGPPPASDSPRGLADQARWEETRKLSGSARWALAIRDNDLRAGIGQRFSCAAGIELSARATPKAWRMLTRIDGDVRSVGTPPKDHYGRRRPALGNEKPICVPRASWMETNASYPSGHAMIGWSWALVLAELLPERSDALFQAGREFGDSRAICGVHYQSDVEAGRVLASAMVARLHATPAFVADEAAARAELRRAARRVAKAQACEDYAGLGPVRLP
jgi:acid phosphatase (class A)